MPSLVIVPTYNEHENLPPLIAAILRIDPGLHVLVVDDDSPDGTGRLADTLSDRDVRVHVLHRRGKQGLGSAYVAAFRYAIANRYERVVQMDADFSHRPEDLPRVLEAADSADVVIGSRNVTGGSVVGWSPLRHVISRGGSLYARLVLRMPIEDCTSGFKCLTRKALESLDVSKLRSNGYAFQVEVNYACCRAGLRIMELPVLFPNRTRGTSKMSSTIALEAAWLVLRLRLGLVPAAVRAVPRPLEPVVPRGL